MVEILVLAVLSGAAAFVLLTRTNLPRPVSVLLGPVVAPAGYVSAVTLLASLGRPAHPLMAAALTLLVFLAIVLGPGGGGLITRVPIGGAVATMVATAATGLLASALNATRLTPDSLSYLAIADILTEPSALTRLRPFTIEARNVSTGALHTLGALDDRAYAEAVTPLVTGFGVATMLWLVRRSLSDRPSPVRRIVLFATAIFTVSAGRPLYDAFFVNSHGPVMAWFFVLVAAGYLLVVDGDRGWALVAAIVAPAILVARPEGPILVAIGFLPLVTDRANAMRRRWLPPLPCLVVAVSWYGAAAAEHPDLVGLSPDEPVLWAIAITLGIVVAAVLATRQPTSGLASTLPWVMAGALGTIAATGAITNPETLRSTLEATAANLTVAGGWGLAWPVLLALATVAAALRPLAHARLLAAPVLAFGALYWASTALRDGGYRVGTGDSGNRMLAHVFLVVVFYVVLTISQAEQKRVPAATDRT